MNRININLRGHLLYSTTTTRHPNFCLVSSLGSADIKTGKVVFRVCFFRNYPWFFNSSLLVFPVIIIIIRLPSQYSCNLDVI